MRIKNKALIGTVGTLSGRLMRCLFRTLKNDIRMPGKARPYDAYLCQRVRFLYSSWHDSAVLAAFGGRHERTVALTSRHRDGTFTACLLKAAKVGIVRGSTGRSGTKALRELLRVAEQFDIVITPDGPRGPRRVASSGIIYIASRTGNEIAPTAFSCANAWEIPGKWTTLTIPKPFSRVASIVGPTLHVPPDLDRDGVEEYRQRLQDAMDTLQAEADAIIAGETVQPRVDAIENTSVGKAASVAA